MGRRRREPRPRDALSRVITDAIPGQRFFSMAPQAFEVVRIQQRAMNRSHFPPVRFFFLKKLVPVSLDRPAAEDGPWPPDFDHGARDHDQPFEFDDLYGEHQGLLPLPVELAEPADQATSEGFVPDPDRVWERSIEIPAYVEPEPSAQELDKYGITEPKELLVKVSTVLLDDHGKGPQMVIGTGVLWDAEFYEVLSYHRTSDDLWANTAIPLYLTLACNRYTVGE